MMHVDNKVWRRIVSDVCALVSQKLGYESARLLIPCFQPFTHNLTATTEIIQSEK